LVASEPFGRRQGEAVSERGDIDAVVDCLLEGIGRFGLCLVDSLFWLGRHSSIVAIATSDIKEDSAGGWAIHA
jgi:hypothetical protein